MNEQNNLIEIKSQRRYHVSIRMAIAYKMRKSGFTLNQIGLKIGKDHSTVVYLIKRCSELIDINDKLMLSLVDDLNYDL